MRQEEKNVNNASANLEELEGATAAAAKGGGYVNGGTEWGRMCEGGIFCMKKVTNMNHIESAKCHC